MVFKAERVHRSTSKSTINGDDKCNVIVIIKIVFGQIISAFKSYSSFVRILLLINE